jgi:DNA primase large subunit
MGAGSAERLDSFTVNLASLTYRSGTVLAEIEALSARNKSVQEFRNDLSSKVNHYLPLSGNSSKSSNIEEERKKDFLSHFILRLAFSRR